ncbi:long-chain acyl-CoA synthetase [Pseudoalteromonas sp. BSi20652]|uniref:AMP-binding protein n=1 Tax=Pseudoalteromonas sp. BSi20652 TaxID=388384 RepID=UPI000231B53E|nr:AMP-binding protein [Pseudoalteromonas sp. BSi20652]GAA59085.1 long-chain acyl-CoA synthetase [Pseudoalteromonas sp. BSi20652]
MSVYDIQTSAPVIVAYCDNKAQKISGIELDQQVKKLVNLLQTFNGDVVAYKLDNTPAWLALDAATIAANKVAVPIAHFFSEQQTQYVLGQCAANLFISDTATRSLGEPTASITLFESYTLYIYEMVVAKPVSYFPETQKVTFTSGSTGQPKGVCLSVKSQMQVAQSLCDKINVKKPVHLCLLPLAVLLENIAGVYAPLKSGGTVHLTPLNELGFVGSVLKQPAQLISAIDNVKPNTLILVPELLACLVAFAEQGWQPPSSLQFIAVGGALVSEMLIAKARNFNLPVYQGYGLSEAASVVSLNTPTNDNLHSAGSVLPHIQTKIENDQLFIKGDLFLGYLNHQPHDKDQWYATGDLVEQRQSTLFIKGRLKNLIITSMGRNINAEWPESLLLSQSGILQAVVFGEGRPFLTAIIYADLKLSNPLLEQHINVINQQLPDYARIQKWHRLAAPLSVQQGLLTTNNRPKRDAIGKQYHDVFEQFYRLGEVINE